MQKILHWVIHPYRPRFLQTSHQLINETGVIMKKVALIAIICATLSACSEGNAHPQPSQQDPRAPAVSNEEAVSAHANAPFYGGTQEKR
jgi:hypothetical protein